MVPITTRTSNARIRASVISSSVRPATSTSALGRLSVSGRNRVPSPAAKTIAFIGAPSFAELLQLHVPHRHLNPILGTQVLRKVLRQIDRAMPPARASERHHQVFEAAFLITTHARIHQRHHTSEKLVHALVLIEVVNHRRVLAGLRLEALLAPRIRKPASIENKSSAVPAFIFWKSAVEGKTQNQHHHIF